MVTIEQQSKIEQLDTFVIESIKDVCATMLNWSPEIGLRTPDATPHPFELKEVNGCIGFGGRMTGSIFFSCSEKLTREMAHAILGQEYPSGSRELSDVVGELTNMLAGAANPGCVITIVPSSCRYPMSFVVNSSGPQART